MKLSKIEKQKILTLDRKLWNQLYSYLFSANILVSSSAQKAIDKFLEE